MTNPTDYVEVGSMDVAYCGNRAGTEAGNCWPVLKSCPCSRSVQGQGQVKTWGV